jgi:hypothetical protein
MKQLAAVLTLLIATGAQAEMLAFGTWRDLAVAKNEVAYSYFFGVVDSSQWREHCMPDEDRTQDLIKFVIRQSRTSSSVVLGSHAHRVINKILHRRYPCS